MAYPYYPYQNFYQPMYQPVQQPVQQQNITAQTYTPTTSGIIWISGESEATMYPIAPNNAVALWDRNGKSIYLKSADATGKPTMTVYDLVEHVQNAPDASQEQTVEYATKSDLSAVVGVVKGFDEMLGTLKSDIDTMKGDMYGIAGKKKPKKTVEVSEDE